MKKLSHTTIIFPTNRQSGQVVLITVLFFLFISLSIVLGFGSAAVKNFKNTHDAFLSKQSYFTAESGVEDIAYRLSTGKITSASQELALNGATTTTTVTPSGSGNEIIAIGNYTTLNRKVRTLLNPTDIGASYGYGIQVGTGGLTLSNTDSGINGNVYVNGNITGMGWNGSYASGTAIAADQSPVDSSQKNDTPTSPSSTIVFDNAASSQDFAQSFTAATTSVLNEVAFYIKRTNTAPTGTVTINIMNDSGSVTPGSTVLATGSFDSAITTSYAWNNVTLSSHPTLTINQTYWIVIDVSTTGSGTKNFILGANSNGYSGGVGKRGAYGGSWLASAGTDAYFRVCMGGVTSTIDGVHIGSNGVGDAIAHTVKNSKIEGTLYCHTGSGNIDENGNAITCTYPSPDPVTKDFTITQAMIDQWKAEAEAGGVVSGYNIDADTSLGPKKIDGNLTTSSKIKMTLTGTVWITGDYIPGGGTGQEVNLDIGYGDNSGVIIVDGKVDLANNISFNGAAGHPKSFILVITTSSLGDAIVVGNNAGAVLLDAPNGTIHFDNNAGAKEATAKKIELSNGSNVTYDTGLIDAHFSNGPGSGGGISGWREVQ